MNHYLEISREEYLKHKPCRTTFFDAHCDPDDVLRIAHVDVDSTLRYIAQQSGEVLFWFAKKKLIPITIEQAKDIVRSVMLEKRRVERELNSVVEDAVSPPIPSPEPEVDDGKVYSDAHGSRVDPAMLERADPFSDPQTIYTLDAPKEPPPAPEPPKETPSHYVYSEAHGGMVHPAVAEDHALAVEESKAHQLAGDTEPPPPGSDPAVEELEHRLDEAFGVARQHEQGIDTDTVYDEATGSHIPKS